MEMEQPWRQHNSHELRVELSGSQDQHCDVPNPDTEEVLPPIRRFAIPFAQIVNDLAGVLTWVNGQRGVSAKGYFKSPRGRSFWARIYPCREQVSEFICRGP